MTTTQSTATEPLEGQIAVYFTAERAHQALKDAGWKIVTGRDRKGRPYDYYVKPGGSLRGQGGEFGTDYLWDIQEALADALSGPDAPERTASTVA